MPEVHGTFTAVHTFNNEALADKLSNASQAAILGMLAKGISDPVIIKAAVLSAQARVKRLAAAVDTVVAD